ncbi:2-oxo-4-hydroxy-4-carboxy-5-ureidoimidazoline decarboxylase [uncultured Thiothrix sp.]|uniref:2-oxo-4-hydroxy-4-carboxy-5-ureidoimidazoline decarboxylase n=1 Tax=uncultured Thiothrix sp. TaxID=223185 RepID=UPI00260E06BE|nr:2-oxo-4-hydroxy-4-carboxy-5-ureidoimidazoline decarboxylase [uncultured Thiothrix sp.]
MKISVARLNTLDQAEFVRLLGGIYEHSPWMAERTWQARPFADQEALLQAFRAALGKASKAEQLALIRAHPDLAGKVALQGELTVESSKEQASAGLDQCNAEELVRFTELNTAYKQKFAFPFIMAVKNATRAQILQGFEQRIHHSSQQEFATALAEINRIAGYRLSELFE